MDTKADSVSVPFKNEIIFWVWFLDERKNIEFFSLTVVLIIEKYHHHKGVITQQ